jgi:hypothetical protein
MDAEVIANVLSHDSGDDNVETQCIASLKRTDTDVITDVSLRDDSDKTVDADHFQFSILNFQFFCDTLEDVDRGLTQSMSLAEIKRIKIPHETAIPTGVYKVIVNYSQGKKRMLPRLLDVPGFSGILIHRGNTENDSSGCILVGENKVKGKVINSTQYEERLVEILTQAQERGEETTITIDNGQLTIDN